MTTAGDHRYCHPCGGEFHSTVTTCPDCGALTVSYPPAADLVDAPLRSERAPEEVMEFDLASLTETERRSLGPWLERAGIAYDWRDGVWLQVGAHQVEEVAEIIDHLPPADDPPDPAARQRELLEKAIGAGTGSAAFDASRVGAFSMLTMTVRWLRSKLRRQR